MHEAQFAVLFSVCVSLFFALIGHVTVCAEQQHCVDRGTCYSLNSGSPLDPSCSFRTTVTPAGYKLLNASVQYDTMQRMDRGVCAPGLRQMVDSVTGDLTCVRKRSWPNALVEEIGDPGASTDHDRHCGKWIAAGSIAHGEQMWAWFDAEATERDVDNLVRALGASRMATTDLGKFRASCRTMVASNSAGASTRQAYNLLAPGLNAESLGVALESVGFLASHYCDAPALVGVGIQDDRFTTKVLPGIVLSSQDLRNALYAVGESRALRDEAIAFADAMRNLHDAALAPTTLEQATAVVRGSYRNTWLSELVGGASAVPTDSARNDPLERFVKTFDAHGAAKARSYLAGVAAVCSLAAQSMVVHEAGQLLPLIPQRTRASRDSRRSAALGRLVAPDQQHDDVTEETLLNASTVRLSSLAALASAGRSSAREVCLAAAKRVFPDDFDRIAFNALVTPALYARLEQLANRLRDDAAVVLSEDTIGNIFAEYDDRSRAYSKIRATKVRIAGAPRGTWAGVDRAFRRPDLASDDSALVIIAKQARAVFLDRLLPVLTNSSICEHAALFPGISRNAYLLLTQSSACSMILPGLIVPPFADERYDEASLATRVGFVMAHEYLHVTAFREQWNTVYETVLLGDYPHFQRVEAIADVGAAATVVRSPGVTNETVCASVSQLFCGRVGWMPSWNDAPRWHPPPNVRGDNVCEFLRTHL